MFEPLSIQGLITSFEMSVPQTHPQDPGKDDWLAEAKMFVCSRGGRYMRN